MFTFVYGADGGGTTMNLDAYATAAGGKAHATFKGGKAGAVGAERPTGGCGRMLVKRASKSKPARLPCVTLLLAPPCPKQHRIWEGAHPFHIRVVLNHRRVAS